MSSCHAVFWKETGHISSFLLQSNMELLVAASRTITHPHELFYIEDQDYLSFQLRINRTQFNGELVK
jgi:hypothetical protein